MGALRHFRIVDRLPILKCFIMHDKSAGPKVDLVFLWSEQDELELAEERRRAEESHICGVWPSPLLSFFDTAISESMHILGAVVRSTTSGVALTLTTSSGIAGAAYKIATTWLAARNGRRFKVKVGDIEVEATQISEKDFLRFFELVQEKADQAKIRELLLKPNKSSSVPPERS